jgi:DNA-binding CsgD family transcriptional regulator
MPPKAQPNQRTQNNGGEQTVPHLFAASRLQQYFGYSLFIAWALSLFFSTMAVLFDVELVTLARVHLLTSIVHAAFAALIALLAIRLSPLNHQRKTLYLAGALGAAGSLTVCFCSIGVFPPAYLFVGYLIAGACAAWIEIAWFELFTAQGVKSIILTLAIATALGCLLYLSLLLLPQVLFIGVVTVLPFASMVLLRPSNNRLLQQPMEPSLRTALFTLPMRMIAVVGLFYLIYGVVRSALMFEEPVTDKGLGAAVDYLLLFLPLILSAIIAFLFKERNIRLVFPICLFLLATLAIVLALSTSSATWTVALGGTTVELFQYLVWFVLIDMVVDRKTTALFAVAILYAARYLGMALGQLGGEFLHSDPVAVALAIMCLLLIAAVTGTGAMPLKIVLVTPNSDHVGIERAKVDAAVAQFALSPREAEILLFWAAGRNSHYIQQKLTITHNTVKTHVAHIYDKIGVNNREELMRTIESL